MLRFSDLERFRECPRKYYYEEKQKMLQSITTPIVGAKFRPPAADVLNNLPGDTELICVREPDNAYDENAIKVMVQYSLIEEIVVGDDDMRNTIVIDDSERYHLGYVPRDKAETLAPYIDRMDGICSGKLCFNLEGRPCVEMSIDDGLPNV